MGLKEVFHKAAGIGFKVAGNVVERCVYTAVADNGIDARTEVNTEVGVLFGEYSLMQRANGNILPGDVKGSILTVALGGANPKAGDYLTKPNELVLTVVSYSVDPAGAVFKVQLRNP